jgi:hypothetical protein
MRWIPAWTLTLLLVLPASGAFAAGGEFSGILVDNVTTPGLSPADTSIGGTPVNFKSKSGSAIGAGLLIATPSADLWAIETGIIYLNRRYAFKTSIPSLNKSGTTSFSQTALEVPVLARMNVADFLAFGLGGYVAYGIGNVAYETDGLLTGSKTQSSGSYSDQDLQQTDYGLLASVAIKIHYEPTRAVLIDFRYAMGLNDVNKDKSTTSPHLVEKYTEFQAMLGIQRTF